MSCRRDRGSILPIVLVVSVVLALVIVGLATYATATLRFGETVEQSTDRLAAAQGALDNALEDLERGSSVCALTPLAAQSGGYTYTVTSGTGTFLNDIDPTVNCRVVGGDINAVDDFAIMMTGLGNQSDELLRVSGGGSSANALKTFEGPVYMASPPDATTHILLADLNIKNGDLWYSNVANGCPQAGDPDVVLDSALDFIPSGYTTKCLSDDWTSLYSTRKPPEPDPSTTWTTVLSPIAPLPDSTGCVVWEPGWYQAAPHEGSYNYFKSGDYYFDMVGEWTIQNGFVLAGNAGDTQPGIPGTKANATDTPSFSTNPCLTAYANDPDKLGAAFYMGGDSKIHLQGNSSLEVSGRVHNSFNIGLQAFDTAPARSSILGDDRIVLVGSGGNKQLSIHGFVWAPRAGLEFGQIANDAVGALTGGAVVAELSAGASANANNFVISVATQPSQTDYVFTTTATNDGTTRVRAVVSYRTDGVYAISSRRVVGITPE